MSINETERKARELRELQALIDEAEVLRDALKAATGDAESALAGEYKSRHKRKDRHRCAVQGPSGRCRSFAHESTVHRFCIA